MEFKADALLLRAADYGENDRMATLLTAGRGKIGAALKGVRKAGAKLSFASQPFCFAEYVFAERGGRYTVTQASLHEGFYGLCEDLGKLYAAASVTELCGELSYEGMNCGELLVAAVEALEGIETSEGDPMSALITFLLRACRFAGYPVRAEDCPICGKKLSGRMYFDLAGGAFNCAECAAGVPASQTTYETVRLLLSPSLGEPPPTDGCKRALRLLRAYLRYQTEEELPALGNYVGMLG